MTRILIIGGYGNFGRFIATRLAKTAGIQLIIAGRSLTKAESFVAELYAETRHQAVAMAMDIHADFLEQLRASQATIVIHSSGPFQNQSYTVALACIACGAHYIDLADGREFVAGIESLHAKAKAAGVMVISGASSVPCLTSALVEHYKSEFSTLQTLDYGISTAQKTTPGLATTAAILSYTGKAFTTRLDGRMQKIYGWQGLRLRKYSQLGWRLLSYCNVPDLELFPKQYPQLINIRFSAGLEIPLLHLGLWVLSYLVRIKLINNLQRAAPWLLRISHWFDGFGSDNSGFHMALSGKDLHGVDKTILFELIARHGDGPYIPCMPAILLARQLANGELVHAGAQACIGLLSKEMYLDALSELNITWRECSSSVATC